jgi:hypothetical protein
MNHFDSFFAIFGFAAIFPPGVAGGKATHFRSDEGVVIYN